MPLSRIRKLSSLAAALIVVSCTSQYKEARRLQDACAGGDAKACATFATMLRKGDHVLRDDTRAAALYNVACDGRLGDGCANLGIMVPYCAGAKNVAVVRMLSLRHTPRD